MGEEVDSIGAIGVPVRAQVDRTVAVERADLGERTQCRHVARGIAEYRDGGDVVDHGVGQRRRPEEPDGPVADGDEVDDARALRHPTQDDLGVRTHAGDVLNVLVGVDGTLRRRLGEVPAGGIVDGVGRDSFAE